MDRQSITQILRKHSSKLLSGLDHDMSCVFNMEHPKIFNIQIIIPQGEYIFSVNTINNLSYNGEITIYDLCRGRGLGPRLVSVREAVCVEAGVERILINHNTNPSFWQGQNYVPLSQSDIDLLVDDVFLSDMRFKNPVYKKLR